MIHSSNLMTETVTRTGTICQHLGPQLGCRQKVPFTDTVPGMSKAPEKPQYPNSLAIYMEKAGLSDPALAKLVGSYKQRIFKLRLGQRKLTVEMAKRLAKPLKTTWESLLEDPGESPDPRRAEVLSSFDAADERGRELIHIVSRRVSSQQQ